MLKTFICFNLVSSCTNIIYALPAIFNSIFLKNRSFHNYPTRQSNEFHLPRLRTLLAQNTFLYTGPKFWNSLSNEIKNARSLSSFKYKLKNLLLNVRATNPN